MNSRALLPLAALLLLPSAADAQDTFQKPRLLWKTFLRRIDGAPAPSPITVYVGNGSYLTKLDKEGRTVWATNVGAQQGTPALSETHAFLGTNSGAAVAVNRKTGKIAWRLPTDGTLSAAPAVSGQSVYFAPSGKIVYAADAQTGKTRWTFARPDDSLGYSAPYVFGGSVYVGGENTLYCLAEADGELLWQAKTSGKTLGTPHVGGGRVFVGGDGAGLSAFSARTGAQEWKFTGAAEDDWFGEPLFVGGTIYVTTYKRYFYAIDARTGREKWRLRLLGNALAQPAYDEKRGLVYATSITFRNNPTVHAVRARTGKLLWNHPCGYVNSKPALIGSRLYIASTNGYLYCFGL